MQTQPELPRTSHATSKFSIPTLVSMALLCALSLVVTFVCNFIPPVAGILSFDLKGVVLAIGGFLFGPVPAFFTALAAALIEMVSFSGTGPIGMVMNLLAAVVFVCPAAYIYKKKHTLSGAVVGLVIGTLLMTGAMLLWNYLITPIYMMVPREVVTGMLLPVFLPFNLVKGGLNTVLTILLYKPVVNALRKAHLAPATKAGKEGGSARRLGLGHVLVAIVVLATLVFFALVLMKVI